MGRLLMIADDFTGALDSGVQFAARGARTCVVTDPAYDFSRSEAEILVLDAETRHLPPEEAYRVVFQAVRAALDAGFTRVYKKTDSALRGNVGAELRAVLDAAGADRMPFLPAFPKLRRLTRGGVHYIDGVPVADSVFGQDPFEPVRRSAVAEIIGEQTDTPVRVRRPGEDMDAPGIQVYDAEDETDLRRTARRLGRDGLRISAGCAGFGAVLADSLGLSGEKPRVPPLPHALFVACGSVNQVTLRQMAEAAAAGFPHVHLNPVQKLEPFWIDSAPCVEAVEGWLAEAAAKKRFILDVNDPAGQDDTTPYARARGLTTEDLRRRISRQLGQLVQRMLDGGLDATILCTGGDTLLALMRAVGVAELRPVCELDTGAVLTDFAYHGKTYHIISKSGGFGEPDLFIRLARSLGAGEDNEEDGTC